MVLVSKQTGAACGQEIKEDVREKLKAARPVDRFHGKIMRLKPAMHAFEKTDEADRRGADRGILVWAQRSLTVGGLDPHVLELDERGALDDHFDRLLSVFAADVAFALGQLARRAIALIADGGFERKVVGSHDVDTGDPVVVDLLAQRQLSKSKRLSCLIRRESA